MRLMFQLRRAFVSRSLVRVLVFNLQIFYIKLAKFAILDFLFSWLGHRRPGPAKLKTTFSRTTTTRMP